MSFYYIIFIIYTGISGLYMKIIKPISHNFLLQSKWSIMHKLSCNNI